MANLKEVRVRISSVKSTQQITKAMKMVSAAKFRKATDAILQFRPFAQKLKRLIANVIDSATDIDNVFTKERDVNKVFIVVVTSNRGLAGAFNNNVIKAANNLIAEKYQSQLDSGNVSIIAIGKKAQDFYTRNGYKVIGDNNEVFNKLSFSIVSPIIEMIMEKFASKKVDKVEIIYNQFKNAAVQNVVTEQLLPLPKIDIEENIKKEVKREYKNYIFDPSDNDIVNSLVPRSIRVQFYKALLDSYASEHGARMTAMDKATDNAGELLRNLTLQYNQARQAAITNEILEIVSGANALADS